MRALLSVLLVGAGCGADTVLTADAPADPPDTFAPADSPAPADSSVAPETDDVSSPETPDTTDTTADVLDDSGGGDALAAERLFDPDHLLEIAITMRPDDWDALRHQTRSLFDILGPGCLDGPVDRVFTYFPADLSVDGVVVTNVGVRKKGFLGSLDPERPSLRIELDELVPDQRLAGLERFTLNNGRQDPSRFKQCLAYETFTAAGLAAPRCNFAHVTVNGHDLGLYVHVEEVKRAFLREHFGAPTGEVWEGQLSDFREGWLATFQPDFDADADPAPLEAVVTALAADDDALLAALDAVIDLDAFFTFWATEVLIGHWDSYTGNTNNFFVYLDPRDDRLRFVPWGTDATFVTRPEQDALPTSVLATAALPHRLYAHPEGRARYHAALRRLLDEVWDEAHLFDRIAAWDALTWDAREPGSGEAVSDDRAAVMLFIQQRRRAIEAELADWPDGPDWPAPLRDAPCARPGGTLAGDFATTWGTLPIEDLFSTGSGTLTFESDVFPGLALGPAGAKAGFSETAGRAAIIIAAPVIGAGFLAVLIETDLPLAPGTRALDHRVTEAYLYYIESAERSQLLGLLGDGALVLEAADASPGAPLRGTLTATVFGLF